MRNPLPETVERGRVIAGPLASRKEYGANGAFFLDTPEGVRMQVIVSNGGGWDHVSVCPRNRKRTPTWEEMHYIKTLFFEPEETVIQYHPAQSRYINNHDYVLHLWKPQDAAVPTPPEWMVGIKSRRRR